MQTFKTLAEFKRLIKPGVNVTGIHHLTFMGRDENNVPIYGDSILDTREVVTVQSNAFTLLTTKKDGSIMECYIIQKPENAKWWTAIPW